MIQQQLNGKIKVEKTSETENTISILLHHNNEWKTIPYQEEIDISGHEIVTQVKYNHEVFHVCVFSIVVYDKVENSWTIAYHQGISGLDVTEIAVKVWWNDAWVPCTIKNATHLLLEPQQSSFCVSFPEDVSSHDSLFFTVEFLGTHKVGVEWHRPTLRDTRFMYNQVLAPLVAATGITAVSSVLFPDLIGDPKKAIGWAVPGWLLLDGVNLFQTVVKGAYTPKPGPFYKDKAFWVKAVASSVGPVVGMAMAKRS